MKLKKMKMVACGLAMVLSLGLLAGCGGAKQTDKKETKDKVFNVGIAQIVEHKALDDSRRGFIDGLKKKGFVEGKNVKLDMQNAQGDQSNLQTIANRFVSNKVDLICAIATPTAQAMANATKTIPIVGNAITSFETAKLVESDKKPNTNVTGANDMTPIKAQIDLAMKLLPQAKTMGIIYTSSEVNSQVQVGIAKAYAKEKNLKVEEVTVSNVNDIQQAASSLIGKVDMIYVPTDNVLASSMPTLIKVTNEAKIPVIAGESSMLKSGAFCSVGIEFYELGVVSGEMAGDILLGKSKPQDMPIASQKEYKDIINKEAATTLGITIPTALQKFAQDIK
ncbi:MAG: ABC transporter substrate-binding protein [Acidaminococcaceae bacterium]|jgi:putative ABC transport system substrate-binding protein|nr:ABC transporter substrate-binding protein [Acidaminococcaceae bacterium]